MRKKQGFISRFRNQFQSLGCSIYQLKFILCNWNHGETTRPRTYENLSTVKAARRNLDTSHQQSSSFSFTRRYFQSSWSNSSSLWSVMEMGVAELPNSKNCLRTRGKFSHANTSALLQTVRAVEGSYAPYKPSALLTTRILSTYGAYVSLLHRGTVCYGSYDPYAWLIQIVFIPHYDKLQTP